MFDRSIARFVALGLPAFLVITLGCGDRLVAPSRTDASTISMSLDGSVDYCALRSEMGSPYECRPEQAIASTFCVSKNHQLLLTRR
jgi:hypothetical protein